MSLTTGKGNTFALQTLDMWFGATAPSVPGTWYAALFTTMPSDDDGSGLVEVTAAYGYARIAVVNNTANFPAAAVSNHVATQQTGATIDFGTASGGNWGTIQGIGFYDALTSGHLGYWGPLSSPKTVNNGDGFKVSSGNGTFTES